MAVLFGVAAFVGAALLFLIEPMLAKLVLPSFGGSPMVWNTCTLFFQVLLLAGYGYVHISTRSLGSRRQPWVHLVLLAAPLLVLPVALPSDTAPPVDGEPALWLLRVLALAAGLPFALLATTGPLLQRWFSWTGHRRAADPYFLSAASNAGSVVGLMGYPFLLEPSTGLAAQTRWWSWAYVGFALMVGACGVAAGLASRHSPGEPPAPEPSAVADAAPGPSLRTRVGWVAVAFIPSSLMLGVTTHVSTDIAAIPLFWTVPLAVYLATFVVAFGRSSRRPPRIAALLAATLCLPVLVLLVIADAWRPAVWVWVVLDLALLTTAGLAAHGRLSASRPPVAHLTGFYLLVALGGALGGLLNGLLAPVVLDRPLEYPVVVALVPLLAVGTVTGPAAPVRRAGRQLRLLRPIARAPMVVMSVVLVCGFVAQEAVGDLVLRRERTFFGSYKVTEGSERRVMVHGTTSHGWEELSGAWVGKPTAYYSRSGPIGDVMSAYENTPLLDRMALVGLGVGTLSAYGKPGQRMDFFEIDPVVVDLARSSFGYLRRSRADVRVVLGDARLSLARPADPTYGLVVLDAFTSDAIPAHLMTVEAVRSYLRRLTSGGLLAFHVSNRHLELAPVLAAVGRELGLTVVARKDSSAQAPASPSTWVVLARAPIDLEPLLTRADWKRVRPGGVRAWTDDYSSLVEVLDVR